MPCFAPDIKVEKTSMFLKSPYIIMVQTLAGRMKSEKCNIYIPSLAGNNLLQIFAKVRATVAVIIEVIITAGRISIGLLLPAFCLKTAMVVGINCIEQVFNTTNVIILSVAVCLYGEIFLSFSIAFKPKGVAAFPSPKKLAEMFIQIASIASDEEEIPLKRILVMGLKSLLKNLVNCDFEAISIIPLQKQIIPSKENDNSTASVHWLIKAFETSSVFPVIMLQIKEIIINKEKSHFIKKPPFRTFYVRKSGIYEKIKKK